MSSKRMINRWQDDNKSYLKVNIKNRLLPTIYGGIIGDCLGVPVEFNERGSYEITDMIGYGTYNQPKGTWSDDTSLTFCLMENMIENGNPDNLMKKFVKYREEGYMTPYNEMFDIGITISNSIDNFLNGTKASKCGGRSEQDNGNGALMRISPLTFDLCYNFNFLEKCAIIKKYTEITHAHPRALVGSIIFIELLIRFYCNNSLEDAIQRIQKLFNEHFPENHAYQKELKFYSKIFDKNFLKLDEKEIKSSGYVVDTLEAAIWCVGTTQDFESAVLKAVNLGGDTDTVASITGSLAGMIYKMEGIPDKWLNQIVQKEKVDLIIKRFMLDCADKEVIKKYGEL